MSADGDRRSGRPIHPIVGARWAILLVFVGLCAWLLPGISSIENDDDVLAFLPPEHPDVKAFRAVADRFQMMEVGLVGLTKGGKSILEPGAVEELRSLAKELDEADGVRLVLSFADLPNPVVHEDGLVVAPLVPEGMDPADIEARVLGSRDAVGNLVSADGTAAALLVFLLPREGGPEAFAARRSHLENIRTVVERGWSGEAVLGGAPFVEMAASQASRSDMRWLSPIVIVVLAVASAVLLRSVTAAGINLAVTGLGVGLIMGGHGRFAEPLTIVSSSTPVMMIALGGAFGVHMLAGYQRQQGSSIERASATLRELWFPVLMSGLTTSVAFFSLVVMPQVPMQRFGVVAGMSMLLLLVLALLVIPSLLAVLPNGLLRHRAEVGLKLPGRPPVWALAVIGVAGIALGLRLRADPDTARVFDERSEVSQANRFFEKHFGGSDYLQVSLEGDLGEAEVLRRIRDLHESLAQVEGVADVRSVVEPLAVVTEGIGGRRGVPENSGRARRALTFLMGHPAMAQLMTDDADGAVIHVKLEPASGEAKVEVAERVRDIVRAFTPGPQGLRVVPVQGDAMATIRREDVAQRLARLTGKPVDLPEGTGAKRKADPELLAKVAELRDGLLDDEEGAVMIEVPAEEIASLQPKLLLEPRGEALEALLRKHLPTLAAQDPDGLKAVAEHLGPWIDEAAGDSSVSDECEQLGFDDCTKLAPAISELHDDTWVVPEGQPVPEGLQARMVPLEVRLTGQPLIGNALAQSVTTSLWQSTLVSLVALSVVLLIGRFVHAIVPAIWTLAFSAGVIALLGHPISIGTSMVACIALGAGVDFAIHLGFRARRHTGPDAGAKAVDELGGVVVVSALQLSLAFCVLWLSELAPLKHFGVGLAVGLIGAALGAVWLTPHLVRGRPDQVKR